jgi:hypothetical protein
LSSRQGGTAHGEPSSLGWKSHGLCALTDTSTPLLETPLVLPNSLDSNLSAGSGASFSSSWGGFATSPKASLLTRQLSGGAPAGASPIAIPRTSDPGGAASPRIPSGANDYAAAGNLFRRHSMATYGAGNGPAAPRAAPAAAAAADGPHRIQSLARSLSKGLSASLDFR